MSLASGQRIGPYEILAPIGVGGMGEVYRARDPRLGREVAIKILPAELASDPVRRQRFDQEARSASLLNHPHIVTIYETGEADSTFYIAMELVDGKTVRELISSGPLPLRRLLHIAVQTADGLAKAHAAGIVHRDLKPENLMVSRDSFVKILDFGLAKLREPGPKPLAPPGSSVSASLTMPGTIVGTAGYMSPEQAHGDDVDFRSDQFAFGAILYEMTTGARAFSRATPLETLMAVVKDEPEPLVCPPAQCPAPLRWIIARCLSKDPEERYASTRDLARELQNVRDHLSEVTTPLETPVLPAPPGQRPLHRRRLVLAACSLLLIAAGVVAGRLGAPSARPVPHVIRPLTYSGHDRSPAFSRDGLRVAFTSDRDGRPRIWMKELLGGGEVALTSGPDDHARFSPDGTSILFSRTEANRTSLYRMAVLGGEPRRVVENARHGDWSPDGRRIVFVRWTSFGGAAGSVLAIAETNGGEEREVISLKDQFLTFPRWSPDGRTIAAIQRGLGGAASIFLVQPDGARARTNRLAVPFGSISSPVWLTSAELLYSYAVSTEADVSGTAGRVVKQRIDTARAETLFFAPSLSVVVDATAGERVLFDSFTVRANLRETVLASRDALPRWLTHGSGNDRQPVFSRDGQWILFSSNRSGNLDLWELSTASGAVKRVTDHETEDWDPAFMPDGSGILWSSKRSGHFEIWTADADGGRARQLSHDRVNAENPTATADGRFIVYNSGNPAAPGIFRMRADGSDAQRLVPGLTQRPEVSPDGRLAVFQTSLERDQTAIRVVRVDDGALVPFEIAIPSGPSNGRARWMPDGRAIAFVAPNEAGVPGVFVQEFAPGRDTRPTRRALAGFDPDAPTESFGISADGSRVVIAAREQLETLLLAESQGSSKP
ncbi:MAG: protein kinase [Thermoanaerobaculia bacterium]